MISLILFVLGEIFTLAVFIGDVDSSSKFLLYPQLRERNKMFRNKDADGDTNIGKLILYKGLLFAAISAAAIYVRTLEDGEYLALLPVWGMGVVEYLTVRSNYKAIKKYKDREAAARVAAKIEEESTLNALETDNRNLNN